MIEVHLPVYLQLCNSLEGESLRSMHLAIGPSAGNPLSCQLQIDQGAVS